MQTLSPGQLVSWTSDFVGPLPTGSTLQVNLSRDAEGLQSIGTATLNVQIPTGTINVMNKSVQSWFEKEFSIPTGSPVHMLLELHEPGTTVPIDSGAFTYTWQPSSNVALVIPAGQSTGGGLTAEQALQLQQVHTSTAITKLLDALTLVDITAPDGGFTSAQLTLPIFGVIVRITQLPPGAAPSTPDGDYFFPSLAVVRVFRSSDLWLRVPIHTSSKLISLWGEALLMGLAGLVGDSWLADLSIQVTFREGVTGQVFLMRTP